MAEIFSYSKYIKPCANENEAIVLIEKDVPEGTHVASIGNSKRARQLSDCLCRLICSQLNGDAIRILYSPHAFIDAFHQLVTKEGFTINYEYKHIYHQALYQWEFLFFECRDKWRLSSQWSLEELYLSRKDLFRYTSDDISSAIDFAMGLGIPGMSKTFFHAATSFASGFTLGMRMFPSYIMKRFQHVADIYSLASQVVSVNSNTFQISIRESLRKANSILSNGKGDMIPQENDLFQFMCKTFTENQLKQPINVIKGDWHYPKINCIRELLHCISRVFCDTLHKQKRNYEILNEYSFSREQVDLIVPDSLQIKGGSCFNTDLSNLQKSILKNQEMVHKCLESLYQYGQFKRELNGLKKFLKTSAEGKFLFTEWPSPDIELSKANINAVHYILQGYQSARYCLLYRKTYDSDFNSEHIEVVLSFVTNSNLFDIQMNNGSNIPIAPLILFLLVSNNPSVFRKVQTKKWTVEELLHANYCLHEKTLENRLKIGLYIRIRNFFAKIYKAKAECIQYWDNLFYQLTGYTDTLMILTDGKPDSFISDEWADVYHLNKWAQVPCIRNPGFPNHEVPHSKVYQWIKDNNQSNQTTQSAYDYLTRQIGRHPEWVLKYRALRSIPSSGADYDDFWRSCKAHMKNYEKILSGIPCYPYEDNVPPYCQLKPKWYMQAVFESILQERIAKDSQQKLNEIVDVLFKKPRQNFDAVTL